MDEWNNHSFIIWRTRNSGNAVRERGGDTREGGRKRRDDDEDRGEREGAEGRRVATV